MSTPMTTISCRRSPYRSCQRALWHDLYGDRRQEIVVIGVDMDEPELRAGFEACLMTAAERRHLSSWGTLEHPFPWDDFHPDDGQAAHPN